MSIVTGLPILEFLVLIETTFILGMVFALWWAARELVEIKQQMQIQSTLQHQQFLLARHYQRSLLNEKDETPQEFDSRLSA